MPNYFFNFLQLGCTKIIWRCYNYSANMYGGDDPELGSTIFLEMSNLKTAKIRVHKNFLEVVKS